MTATATLTNTHAFIHLEWWADGVTGRELATSAIRVLVDADLIAPEAMHVYNTEALGYSPDGYGELDLYFSIMLNPALDFDTAYRWAITELRSNGFRVKTAGPIPAEMARTGHDEFFEWLCRD